MNFFSPFKDSWLQSRTAARLFTAAAAFAIIFTPWMMGWVDLGTPADATGWRRLVLIVATFGLPPAVLFLWFCMLQYWLKLDRGRKSVKGVWFVVLLLGVWLGDVAYLLCVYWPQVAGAYRAEDHVTADPSIRKATGTGMTVLKRLLIGAWILWLVCFAAVVILGPVFGGLRHVAKVLPAGLILLVFATMAYVVATLYLQGTRLPRRSR